MQIPHILLNYYRNKKILIDGNKGVILVLSFNGLGQQFARLSHADWAAQKHSLGTYCITNTWIMKWLIFGIGYKCTWLDLLRVLYCIAQLLCPWRAGVYGYLRYMKFEIFIKVIRLWEENKIDIQIISQAARRIYMTTNRLQKEVSLESLFFWEGFNCFKK